MNKSLEITTQITCLNCGYCPRQLLENSYWSLIRRMSLRTFKTCIDKLPVSVDIHFSGFSEPFLNPACIDMIEYVFSLNHKVIIYTTTIGLTKKKIERLSQYKFKEFVIHCPDNKTVFDEVAFNRNVDLLDKYDIPYKLLSVQGKEYFENKTVIMQPLVNRACISEKRISGKIKCRGNRFNQNVLLPNGDVYLCCEDYGLKHKLENLLKQDFYGELFKSETYKKIQTGLNDDSIDILCRRCSRAYNDK